MALRVEDTLDYVRSVSSRHKKKTSAKKGKGQTIKEYLISRYGPFCAYCHNQFKREELCLIRKNHSLPEGRIFEEQNNKIIACKECSSRKSDMDHHEFIHLVESERLQKRQEIVENYPKFATEVFGKYEQKCIYCEYEHGFTPPDKKLTIDHKKAIFRNGDNDKRNLASACEEHNKEKGSRTPTQYFKYLKRQGRKYKQGPV